MGWFADLRTSATWRSRRDLALANIHGDGTITLADLMPDAYNADIGEGRGFPTYLSTQRALDRGAPSPEEKGITGTENLYGYIYNDEYNPKLAGKAGIAVYDNMRRSDAQCHATLDMVKLPLRSADVVIEAASDDPEDQRIADFCAAKLLDDDALHEPWDHVLRHILLSEDFGTSAVELVYKMGDNGEVALDRLAPRLPKTFERFDVDDTGTLTQLVQYGPKLGHYDYYTIPSEYLAVFPREKEGDNFWGMSILRTAYKHWYYKNEIEHIDMIAHDKYGVGTPHAKLAPGYPISRPGELARLENALLGIRSGQRNFLITSDKVTVDILVASSGGGRPVRDSLDYHNTMIARNVLANHLALGDAPHGTYNLGIAFMDLFLYALQARAGDIAGVFKRQILKRLCDFNFTMTGRDYPTMRFQNLTNFNVEKMATAFAPLVAAKIITVTDDVEDMFRQLFDLPPLAKELRRENGYVPHGIDLQLAIAGDPTERTKALAALGAAPNATPIPAPGVPAPAGPRPVPAPPIAASDIHIHMPPTETRGADVTMADVTAAADHRATELQTRMREFVASQLKDLAVPPQPINVQITLPNGHVVRTTSTEITRDARGLITGKRDRTTETPADDTEGD